MTQEPESGVAPATTKVLATSDGSRWHVRWQGAGVAGQLLAPDRSHVFLILRSHVDAAPGAPDGVTTLLATSDGGRIWAAVWHARAVVSSMSFAGARTGLAAVTPGPCGEAGQMPPQTCPSLLLRTADGGRHWSPVRHLDGPVVAVAATSARWWAVQSRLGIAGRGSPRVAPGVFALYSDDQGRTWARGSQIARFDVLGLNTRANLLVTRGGWLWLSLLNLDSCAMHGCVTAGLWRSADGGVTWSDVTPKFHVNAGCGLGSVVVADDPAGAVHAASGQPTAGCGPPAATLVQWTPAGWREVYTWAGQVVMTMSWPSHNVGYTSFGDTMGRTRDGGRHWTRVWPAQSGADGGG